MKKRTLRQTGVLIAVSIILAGAFNSVSVSGISWLYHPLPIQPDTEIHLYEAWQIFREQSAAFIDARNVPSFNRGHVPGAVNIPYNVREIEKRSAGIKKDARLVVYCFSAGCHQADILAARLKKQGFLKVVIFRDGYREWKKANYPLATSTGQDVK